MTGNIIHVQYRWQEAGVRLISIGYTPYRTGNIIHYTVYMFNQSKTSCTVECTSSSALLVHPHVLLLQSFIFAYDNVQHCDKRQRDHVSMTHCKRRKIFASQCQNGVLTQYLAVMWQAKLAWLSKWCQIVATIVACAPLCITGSYPLTKIDGRKL